MKTLNETVVVIVRGFISFVTLLIFARLLGKEEIKQLTFFDYIAGITIGSIAANLTVSLNERAWPMWAGLATWVILTFFLQWATLRSRYVAKYVDGEPAVVIMNGKIMEETMRKARLKVSDLAGLLRYQGIFDLTVVEFAVYEKDGNLSVLKKGEYQPVTLKDMNLPSAYKGISTELIYDGVVIEQNLRDVNLTRDWLEAELRKNGIWSPGEVFFAVLDTEGKLFIDTYNDHVRHVTDASDYTGPN